METVGNNQKMLNNADECSRENKLLQCIVFHVIMSCRDLCLNQVTE